MYSTFIYRTFTLLLTIYSLFYAIYTVTILNFMKPLYNESATTSTDRFPSDLLIQMKKFLENSEELKKETKTLMQFGAFMRDEALERGVDALAIEMSFDQKAILYENIKYISAALDCNDISFINVDTTTSSTTTTTDSTSNTGSASASSNSGSSDTSSEAASAPVVVVKDKKKADASVPGNPSAAVYYTNE